MSERKAVGAVRRGVGGLLCGCMTAALLSGCVSSSHPSPSLAPTSRAASTVPDPVVHDLGARTFAEGPVKTLKPVVIRAGGPRQPRYDYTIVRRDTVRGIEGRFEMCGQDFQDLDPGALDVDLQVGSHLVIARSTLDPFAPACV